VRYRWVPKRKVAKKAYLREDFSEEKHCVDSHFFIEEDDILWEYFGFKETSLDVKDCRIEPKSLYRKMGLYRSVPYLAFLA